MKNDVLVSVIVPVYNVEKYLHECIDSIIAQTYKNIEILLIDDGSTDSSGSICDEYSLNDSRLRVFHKKNEGVSVARNIGIDNANGEYCMFVDADDYIHPRACELLVSTIIEERANVIFAKYLKVEKVVKFEQALNYNKLYSLGRDDALLKILDIENVEGINAVAKLYKTEIIKKHHFLNGYPLGEDQEFIFSIFQDFDRVTFIDACVYFYMYRENSAVHKKVNIENEIKLHDIYRLILNKNYYTRMVFEKLKVFKIIQCNLTSLNKLIMSHEINKEFEKKLCGEIRTNTINIGKSDFSKKKKIQLYLAGYAFPLYRIIYALFK